MVHSNEIRENLFYRLHHLQALYSNGAFPSGSPKHLEILVLEELESLFVQERRKQTHEVESRLSESMKQSVAFADQPREPEL